MKPRLLTCIECDTLVELHEPQGRFVDESLFVCLRCLEIRTGLAPLGPREHPSQEAGSA